MNINPMEALWDNPGLFHALTLALLLDCILSAREAPTGPQVRTPKYELKGIDFETYNNNTFGCTEVKRGKVRGVCKGNANGVGGTAYEKMPPVTWGERRKRQEARRGRYGKLRLPLCCYHRSRGQGV
ncbi:hypothetical protein K438DRAFT_1770073 [Mycena galopus ATCC 62051]|nr:hypothetical protein K438DRAFT_1770073 [Mycena galopus ATCC 62051]